ncbi:PIG-L family deacetylase [Streptodolium elevatio]|uniref:PIG-L family deacetylase n=1 Tax=Streptodolium elevatio TaxID=3157996 RepID=A0ABV3DK76_9ACTN
MNPPPGTRRFLVGTVLVALLVATATAVAVRPYLHPRQAARNVVPLAELGSAPPPAGTAVQFVAHQDDDLYFMNPDVARTIASGAGSVTVYLTAGESDGRNGPGARRDPNAYAAARNNGARAAHAAMATGDRSSPWHRQSVRLRGGAVAELDTLVAAPRVRLLFLNTSKQEKFMSRTARLRTLWDGSGKELSTLVPDGSRAGGPYTYTRAELIASLADLLRTVRPTLIRTMDPDPDHQVHDARHPRGTDFGDHSDHQDHTAAALFAWEALREYAGPGGGRHVTVTAYRGYYNERWPANLGPGALAAKRGPLDIYGWADGENYCKDPAGCGDRKVGGRALDGPWPRSTTYRYPAGGLWLAAEPDRRLSAWAVVDGAIARWRESAPGSGEWHGPEMFAGPGEGVLAPGLALVRTPDGRMHVFALRIAPGGKGRPQRQDIVGAVETVPGGALGGWSSLGAPDPTGGPPGAADGRGVGEPVAAAGGDGRLHVFVRDHSKGVSTRVMSASGAGKDGGWGPWTALGGGDVVEGLAAVTAADGHVEVFGTGRDSVHRWSQAVDGTVRVNAELPADRPVGPPAVARDAEGRLLVVHREAGSGRVVVVRQHAPGAGWEEPFVLPATAGTDADPAGFGAVAADGGGVAGPVVAARTCHGAVQTAAPSSAVSAAALPALPGPVVVGPAVATDAGGRTVVAGLRTDGTLVVAAGSPGAGSGSAARG